MKKIEKMKTIKVIEELTKIRTKKKRELTRKFNQAHIIKFDGTEYKISAELVEKWHRFYDMACNEKLTTVTFNLEAKDGTTIPMKFDLSSANIFIIKVTAYLYKLENAYYEMQRLLNLFTKPDTLNRVKVNEEFPSILKI